MKTYSIPGNTWLRNHQQIIEKYVILEQDDHVYCAKESSIVQMKNPMTISFPKHNNKLDLCKAEQILKNIDLRNCVEELIIKETNSACALLTSKRDLYLAV